MNNKTIYMKKLFTLCIAMLLTAMAQAQVDETFQFVDAQGNVVADGTTIVINQVNDEGQMSIPLTVKNVSGEKAAVSLYETIDAMPNGEWQTCAFGNCMKLSETGYSPKSIVNEDYSTDIQTEWIPEAGKYATWEATLQVHVFNITQVSRFGQVMENVGNEIIGYGPTVTVRFEYKDTQSSEAAGSWWGYTTESDKTGLLGVSGKETYDCAIFVPADQETAKGKTINSIRFKLNSTNVSDVKVWVSEDKTPDDVNAATRVEAVANPIKGVNEVKLSKPYTIGEKGIYVGYSFTITALESQDDSYPIHVVKTYKENALWLRTSSTIDEWQDSANEYGCLYLQLLLEGKFYENAIVITSNNLGDYTTLLGNKATVYLPVTNTGTAPVTSIEYTIATNGGQSSTGSIGLSSQPIVFGESRTLDIDIDAEETVGVSNKTLTIDKVNGKAVENGQVEAQFTLATVGKMVDRAIAVEEFTGTTNGWCPRGFAGLKKLNEKFGDKVVTAAVHGFANNTSEDAMYLASWGSRYAWIFTGYAPRCEVNRAYGNIDPYYGTGTDICDDVERELNIPARVGISLKGEWSADSTQVVATASLEPVVDGPSYTIEYALIADGLTGTSDAWNQKNNYPSEYSTSDFSKYPDIAQFCKDGEYGQEVLKGWIFNDVVIATSYINGKNLTTAPGKLEMGKTVANSYTLTMPNDKSQAELIQAIDKSKVAVVAFVIGADGTVANAAKYYMKSTLPGDVNGDGAVNVADISAVISVMAGTATYGNADVNGDGSVNVADISSIITEMAGK